MATAKNDFPGIWHYRRWYPNTKHYGREDITEFYVQIKPSGDGYVMHSLTGKLETPGSYSQARFTVDHNLVTGTYLDDTAPKGEWEGTVYRGAFQLIVFENRKYMEGKWVGIGYNNAHPMIFTGRFVLEQLDEKIAAKPQ